MQGTWNSFRPRDNRYFGTTHPDRLRTAGPPHAESVGCSPEAQPVRASAPACCCDTLSTTGRLFNHALARSKVERILWPPGRWLVYIAAAWPGCIRLLHRLQLDTGRSPRPPDKHRLAVTADGWVRRHSNWLPSTVHLHLLHSGSGR